MGQQQHDVPLQFADGSTATAVRTGNNAAWNCKCGADRPLIGYSDVEDTAYESSLVECRSCKRKYLVVAAEKRKAPTHVTERA
jgi:hypothetical protein